MSSAELQVRRATAADIAEMHQIRLAVSENRLSANSGVSEQSYRSLVSEGAAWVAETGAGMAGFAIVDAATQNVWAVFVDPNAQGQGVGKALHDRLLQWSRAQGIHRLWLSTSPGTRAEQFYRKLGWSEFGLTETGEIRFERRI